MKNDPERIREVVPSHVAYWKNSNIEKYVGGPFADRTGGLISFEPLSIAEATAIIEKDPFVVHGLLKEKWIKEWMPEQ
jgi:uncharacterized protein YciI